MQENVPAIEQRLNTIEAMLKAREIAEQRIEDSIATLATKDEFAALQRQLQAVERIAVSKDEVDRIVQDQLNAHPTKDDMARADLELKTAISQQLHEMKSVQNAVDRVFNEAMASFNRLSGLVEGFLELIKSRNHEINNLAENQRKLDEELKEQIETITDLRSKTEHNAQDMRRDLNVILTTIRSDLLPDLKVLVSEQKQRRETEKRRKERVKLLRSALKQVSSTPLGVRIALGAVVGIITILSGNELLQALLKALIGG